MRDRGNRRLRGAAVALSAVALVLLHQEVGAAPEGMVEVETTPSGEISIKADRATVVDVLRALAASGAFEVRIDESVERPPVSIEMAASPVEDVVRNVLHGRNFALFYDTEGTLTRVFVLPPSSPTQSRAAARSNRGRTASARR